MMYGRLLELNHKLRIWPGITFLRVVVYGTLFGITVTMATVTLPMTEGWLFAVLIGMSSVCLGLIGYAIIPGDDYVAEHLHQ